MEVYHATVGNNAVLELDFAIDDTGNVQAEHAAAYKALGDWARACYSQAMGQKSGNSSVLTVTFGRAVTMDRVMVQEAFELGERVRAWRVDVQATVGGGWAAFTNGTAVGYKRISLGASQAVVAVRLSITSAVAQTTITNFAVYAPCPSA